MKISIVIPSYNQGHFIEETLLSVMNQSYKNYEIIVIDGGSTDRTCDILKRYNKEIAYWVSEKDKGQTDALIKGFNKASGDIFCWLCSDDLLEYNALQIISDYFTKYQRVKVVTGNAKWIDTKGSILKNNKDIPFIRWIWLYTYNYIIQPSTFWRKEVYEEVGGLDITKNLTMDADLWIKFAQNHKIKKINNYISRLRLYPDQKNVKFREESNKEDIMIRKKYGVNRESFISVFLLTPFAYLCRIFLKFIYGSYFSLSYFKSISRFRL